MFHTHSHCTGFTALICVNKTAPFAFSISLWYSAKVSREPCSTGCPALTGIHLLPTCLSPQAKAVKGKGMEIQGPQHHAGVGGLPPLLSAQSLNTTRHQDRANFRSKGRAVGTLSKPVSFKSSVTQSVKENAMTYSWLSVLSVSKAGNMTTAKWGSSREDDCFRRSAESKSQDAAICLLALP